MALEIIEIENAEEQNLLVTYGNRRITIEIRWNDVKEYWYLNLKENNEYIAPGITTVINSNLLYDILELGKLYFIDTQYGTTTNPIVKSDLGKRIALARDYA